MCAFLADDRIDADYELVLAAIAKLEREQANLARALALLDDARSQAPILARLKEIADEIETLRHDLRTIEGRRARHDTMLARADDLATWCEHVRAELPTLAPEERRWALEAFGVRILVFSVDHGERVRILGLPEEALTVPMDTTSSHARRVTCFLQIPDPPAASPQRPVPAVCAASPPVRAAVAVQGSKAPGLVLRRVRARDTAAR